MQFPAKITSSCISVAMTVDWVILHWYTCGADGRSLGRAVYGHVITKFSRMGRLLHFLTHGAPLARFARENSAIAYFMFLVKLFLQFNIRNIWAWLEVGSCLARGSWLTRAGEMTKLSWWVVKGSSVFCGLVRSPKDTEDLLKQPDKQVMQIHYRRLQEKEHL